MEGMPTKAYFVLDAKETADLQREAGDLRATTEDPKASWVERSRAASRLETVERLLQVSRTAERQVGHAAEPQGSAPAATNAAGEGQFMDPVPYFESEQPPRAAGNAAPVQPTEPTHVIQCARGYRIITERPDGRGAILITRDEEAPKK